MNAGELITQLQTFPPDTKIMVFNAHVIGNSDLELSYIQPQFNPIDETLERILLVTSFDNKAVPRLGPSLRKQNI